MGLPSSGLHSNGFSLARQAVAASGLALGDPLPGGEGGVTVGEALLEPTAIYVRDLLRLAALEGGGAVKGAVHVTGGGFQENIPRVLPDGLGATVARGAWEVSSGLCCGFCLGPLGGAWRPRGWGSGAWLTPNACGEPCARPPQVPAVFRWLQAAGGVGELEMFRTFNMGVGMILVVAPEVAPAVLAARPGAFELGAVAPGEGVTFA